MRLRFSDVLGNSTTSSVYVTTESHEKREHAQLISATAACYQSNVKYFSAEKRQINLFKDTPSALLT